ncbi:glycoside hydrolase family 16 protein [Mycolicibacterium sp.]|uniref:glycoside hydrolase family 16 protein n=1 Tax=Mycolicibacterium sp. TaxID=2320850 RepID=UPI001A2AD423|nr:glycoside hydrolase family 16 protein [Mycolicibacterium sp.]MBJ7337662.1 glycoside hydrolase family 16 protein [Mycolicibacterium sp.]
MAVALAVSMVACSGGTCHGEPATVPSGSFSTIVASRAIYAEDDFDGPPNSAPDPGMWNIETGGVGWGAGEAQAYTADPANVRQDGSGNLVIEARNDNGHISSARLNTQGKVDITDGVVAARIKMPAGQGLHPAFWLLGQSLGEVGWPASGEIDVVELLNRGSTAYFTVIGPRVEGQQGSASHSQLQLTSTMGGLTDGFHTYWLSKQPHLLVFGIDENTIATVTPTDLPPGQQWIYDAPYFAVLNLAVGGVWPGPVGDGVLPKKMTVDWVRFYR